MGSGSWTSKDWNNYSKQTISGRSTAQIYSSTNVKSEFDPKNIKTRESCDGSDHPTSNAIIIGLDVTGSMGDILNSVANKLSVLVQEAIGYDYEAALAKCEAKQKKQRKDDDVGGDALELAMKRGKRNPKKKEK